MPKYKVSVELSLENTYHLEADSEDEAIEMAEDMLIDMCLGSVRDFVLTVSVEEE